MTGVLVAFALADRPRPNPKLDAYSAMIAAFNPRIARVDPTLIELVEATSGLILEGWQRLICDRLQAITHQKGVRLLIHGPPQFGKPCSLESMILLHDGRYRRLGDIRVGDRVISHTGHPRPVLAVHEQGDLPCVEIRTNHGRSTIAALDHPFLTPEGWVRAADLRVEQVLANVPTPLCSGTSNATDAEFELAGYFIGDGAVGPAGPSLQASITCNDPSQGERILAVAAILGFRVRIFTKQKTTALTYAFSGGVRDWLRATGIGGHRADTKCVPDWVYTGSPQQIGIFLGAYFSCDGNVTGKGLDRHGKERPDATVEFYSISADLLHGVQRLLLRLGIQSRFALKNGRYRGDRHSSYRLTFSTQDNIAQFAALVTVPGVKGVTLAALRPLHRCFPPTLLSDPVVSITPVGPKPCRCLTVSTDHTFTVDDLVVHNSVIIAQRFPVYTLGINPDYRVRLACYNVSHAIRFSAVNLALMNSPEVLRLFPDAGTRVPSIASKEEWSTLARAAKVDANPSFKALGLGSGFTGLGVDTLIIDDPYKDRMEARSEATNAMLWGWWTDTATSRMNPDTNVVVMFHRWWEGDFAGRLLKQGGWELMRFPAIADGLPGDPTGRAIGEPLSPRYTLDYLAEVTHIQGTAFDALFQGTPFPHEGGLFKRGKATIISAVPAGITRRVRRWDIASSHNRGAYTAGVLMSELPKGRWLIEDVIRGQWGPDDRDAIMLEVARLDAQRTGAPVLTIFPQDPGADQTLAWVRLLAGVAVETVKEKGDKLTRADPLASQWNVGNVLLLAGPWNHDYLEEMARFDQGVYKDQVDASSGAFAKLAPVALPSNDGGAAGGSRPMVQSYRPR